MVLLAVSPFLIFSAPVYSQASWPTSWIEIDWDKNENGPNDDWRDVEYAYYQYDSSYFYLKLECYDTPGKEWAVAPDGDGRYKWFIDFEGNLTFSGENIFDAEYLLFVEDTDEDASGEMYLLYETNGDNNFGEYEPWPPANYSNYEVTDPNVGGWRIFDTYQMEMYISWSSIGNPSSFWITWATDQENSNLDQGPTTDHADEEQPIPISRAQYTLTITTTTGGTTSPPPGDHVYSPGTNVSVTATPDACYQFDHWELDGVDVGSANPYTVTMDANHTLHAVFTQINYTLTITTTTGGTTSPSPGAHDYPCCTNVSVTAVPDTCYQFDHWELDGVDVGSANPYTVHMDSDHTLHAVFAITNYTLTITSTAGGTTNPSPGSYKYSCSSSVPVTATPDPCYQFDHWELDGVDVGSANPYTVTMDGDHTLHAVFTQITYTLTITTTTGGTTSPSPSAHDYPCCSNVSVTAIPDSGFAFDHWELDGVDVGSANPYTVHMDSDHTLHAVFTGVTYTLTITTTAGGTTSPSPGAHVYPYCTNVSVTATPDPCYQFDHWELDSVDVGSANPYVVHMDMNHTLKAVFVRKTFWLTIQVEGTGTTDPSPGVYKHNCCEYVSVAAIETDPCWRFDHWELDGSWNYSNPISVHVNDNYTLKAVFVRKTFWLTIQVTGTGTTSPSPGAYQYNCSEDASVTAIETNPCWKFDHWMLDGTPAGSSNPITVHMDANHTLHAVFTQINYTLTVNIVGSGSVTKNPDLANYPCGTQVTLTANPDPCWTFSGWSGDASGTATQITITMDSDKTVTATFTQEEYTLAINIVGSGSVTKSPDMATYPCGTVVTLTAVPDAGWKFSYWSGDASGTTSPTTVTMDGHKTVTATFIEEMPPTPVGGYAAPIDIAIGKEVSHSLFSQIGLAFALLAAMAAAILLTKRRSKTSK